MKKIKPYLIIMATIVGLSGCATLARDTTTLNSSQTSQKSVGSVCATTGAALQSLVVAGATGVISKIKPEVKVLYPVCESKTPEDAITESEAEAYQKIVEAAAPYLGD